MKRCVTEKIYVELGARGLKNIISWDRNPAPGLVEAVVSYQREYQPVDPFALREQILNEMGALGSPTIKTAFIKLYDDCVDKIIT